MSRPKIRNGKVLKGKRKLCPFGCKYNSTECWDHSACSYWDPICESFPTRYNIKKKLVAKNRKIKRERALKNVMLASNVMAAASRISIIRSSPGDQLQKALSIAEAVIGLQVHVVKSKDAQQQNSPPHLKDEHRPRFL